MRNAPGFIVWKLARNWKCYQLGEHYIVTDTVSVALEKAVEIKELPRKLHLRRIESAGLYEAFHKAS